MRQANNYDNRQRVAARTEKLVHPALEATPDINRAETRFAAEVAVAELSGQLVPTWAHERAATILGVLANG